MALVRVTTTALCARHLQIGNHVYEPAQSREIDMTADELAGLQATAATMPGVFESVGLAGAKAESAKAPAKPVEPTK